MATTHIERTDIHRPSAIIPGDYDLICYTYRGPDPFAAMEAAAGRRFFTDHMKQHGARFAQIDREGGGCHICGAYFSWGAIWYHAKTNAYIETGWICADKMDFDTDGAAFRSWKKRIENGAGLRAGKAKAEQTLADMDLTRAWEISLIDAADTAEHQQWAHGTTCDIVGKLIAYGSISEKQENFLRKLAARFDAPAPAPKDPGNYIGSIKERRCFDITIAYIAGFETDYGWMSVYGMEDAEGNLIIWKTTAALRVGEDDRGCEIYARRGDSLTIKGTIKAHEEYRGRRQTMINRVTTEATRSLAIDRNLAGKPATAGRRY